MKYIVPIKVSVTHTTLSTCHLPYSNSTADNVRPIPLLRRTPRIRYVAAHVMISTSTSAAIIHVREAIVTGNEAKRSVSRKLR